MKLDVHYWMERAIRAETKLKAVDSLACNSLVGAWRQKVVDIIRG